MVTTSSVMDAPLALKSGPSTALSTAVDSVVHVLRQLAEFIASLSDAQYVSSSGPGQTGGIGSHVRHCLDHATALLQGLDDGVVDYDRRRRGSDLEIDRRCAFDAISDLIQGLRTIGGGDLERELTVWSAVDSSGRALATRSTLAREIVFVLSHTIHHHAMIAGAARRLGADVPHQFGYAPATIAFLNGTARGANQSL